MRVLPYGADALLVELDDPAGLMALAEALQADPDVLETVPAARTVLVRTGSGRLAAVRSRLPALLIASTGASATPATPARVVLDVRYDGVDLAPTAAELGLDIDGLVRAHTAADYVVAFCGFAPGFAYLRGLDPALHVARVPEPRTRVPAGSVAVAGEYTGVYPRASPGGWRLLGTTDAALWESARPAPALLALGTPVRFRAVR